MVSTLDLANVDVDGIPAIDLRQHSHADRCIPPADRFRPVFRYVTKNGCFARHKRSFKIGIANFRRMAT
jgi:hypothetical protein